MNRKHSSVLFIVVTFAAYFLFNIAAAFADDQQETLLVDVDGDARVSYLGFGDSITFGVGDDDESKGGYIGRLGVLLGISVFNKGVPGETITVTGENRFVKTLQSINSDVVGLFEGANDAFHQTASGNVRRAQQKVINVSFILGRTVVLVTLPIPCCEHAALVPYVGRYNSNIQQLANINNLRIADIQHAWETTCENQVECELYNLPSGLHPNGRGYDVIAQTLAASLLGIDIFLPDGAAQLESALGLEAGTIIVKPDLQSKAKINEISETGI